MRSILLMSALLGLTSSAHAYDDCSEPEKPWCVQRYGAFDDEDDFNRCKSQILSYRSDVDDYLSCLKKNSEEAASEYEDAVSAFNRRAKSTN
ncbi:hypothetical protein [Mesorhizobium sp. 43Arga]